MTTPRTLFLTTALLTFAAANAASYTWDATAGNATIDQGTGSWDTTTTTWTTDAGATNSAWGNTAADTATFGTAAGANTGTVTVAAGGVTANSLVFANGAAGAYTVSGGTITLAGTAPSFVNNNTRAATTINSVLTGAGSVTTAANTNTRLYGANSYTGGTTTDGEMVAKSNTAFGTGAVTIYAGVLRVGDTLNLANNFTFNTGTTFRTEGANNAMDAATISGAVAIKD